MGLALAVALSIAAIVLALRSAGGPGDLERIRTELQLQINCARATIQRPSRAPVLRRWTGLVQTADVVCMDAGARIVYARFADGQARDRALIVSPPPARYCLMGSAVLFGRLAGLPSTALGDLCQSLGGRLVTGES